MTCPLTPDHSAVWPDDAIKNSPCSPKWPKNGHGSNCLKRVTRFTYGYIWRTPIPLAKSGRIALLWCLDEITPNKPLPTIRIVSSDICEKGLLSQAKARVKIDHFSTQNKYIAICHVDYFNSGKQQLRLLPRSLTRRFDTSWKFKKIISRSKNWKNIQKWHKIKNFPRQSYSLAHFSRFDIWKRNRFAFFKTSFFAFKTRLDEIKVGEKWKV